METKSTHLVTLVNIKLILGNSIRSLSGFSNSSLGPNPNDQGVSKAGVKKPS